MLYASQFGVDITLWKTLHDVDKCFLLPPKWVITLPIYNNILSFCSFLGSKIFYFSLHPPAECLSNIVRFSWLHTHTVTSWQEMFLSLSSLAASVFVSLSILSIVLCNCVSSILEQRSALQLPLSWPPQSVPVSYWWISRHFRTPANHNPRFLFTILERRW